MRFEKWLSCNEAGVIVAAFAETRLLPQTRRAVTLLVAQSCNGAVEAVPRHIEMSNQLAKKICRNLSVPEIGG